MQAASVAVHEPARRVCYEFAERCDPVLQRHLQANPLKV
jgi:hypothetical protein